MFGQAMAQALQAATGLTASGGSSPATGQQQTPPAPPALNAESLQVNRLILR